MRLFVTYGCIIKLHEQTNLIELHFSSEDFEVIQILYFSPREFLDGSQNLTFEEIKEFAEKHLLDDTTTLKITVREFEFFRSVFAYGGPHIDLHMIGMDAVEKVLNKSQLKTYYNLVEQMEQISKILKVS